MARKLFDIRYGEFHDVTSRPQRFKDISFVSARITLHEPDYGNASTSKLNRYLNLNNFASRSTHYKSLWIDREFNAPWVLGRLIRLFGTIRIPESERCEKTCFFESMLAVLHARKNLTVPFECSDHYGDTFITFSGKGSPAENIQIEIAKAFWGLLLSDPSALEDYEDNLYHEGTGYEIHFGVKDGQPFCREELSEE